MTPHEGSTESVPNLRDGSSHRASTWTVAPSAPGRWLDSCAEDSPSGLWRSLGKRVGLTPSGVQIPYPPRRRACDVLKRAHRPFLVPPQHPVQIRSATDLQPISSPISTAFVATRWLGRVVWHLLCRG